MASTTLPRAQNTLRGRWLAGGGALVVIMIIAAVLLNSMGTRATTTPSTSTTTVTRGTIIASVSGSGTVAAAQTLDLAFQSAGTVTQVLVKEGERVAAGQALATIDSRDL